MRKALKERILNDWKSEIEHTDYLWKITAEHIYTVLKTVSEKKAKKIFQRCREKYRDMACSIYYERALKELEGKEFIEEN